MTPKTAGGVELQKGYGKPGKIQFSIVIALAPWRDAEILGSIEHLDYPREKFEVLVRKGLNVSDNRNEGAAAARGKIILFLDDDAIIDSDFLTNVDAFFKEHPEIDVLGGPQLTPPSDKTFARVSGYGLANPFSTWGMAKRYRVARLTLNADSSYITGANLICRKKVLDRVTFDRTFYPGDDVNFVMLSKEKGFRVAYSPDIYIYHRRRKNSRELYKQIFDYAYVRSKEQISREIFKNPLFFTPSAFLIYLLLVVPLSFVHWVFLLPLGLYVVLSLGASLYEAVRNEDALALVILPWAFLVIHVSYGAGFLWGMVNRFLKKK